MHDQLATYVQVCIDVKLYIPDHIATHSYSYVHVSNVPHTVFEKHYNCNKSSYSYC